MKPRVIPTLLSMLAAALVGAALPGWAQLIYSENFDADVNPSGNWVTNALANSPVDLFFDYSTIGIPSAPNSTGGTTRGVKLNANLGTPPGASGTGVFPGGVSVSPMNFSLPVSGNWVIHCDWWINFNGPAPGGGSGSTQEGGLGFGTVGTSAQVVGQADSLFFVTTGDGGTSSDYRIYSGAFQASLQDGNPAYLAGIRNNTAPLYSTNFPGQSAPAAQLALYPQQTGTAQNGTLSFKWHDFKIEKIGPYVTWSVDNVPLAIVDATTNGIVGDKLLLTYSDINSGNSTDPNAGALSFSLYDNLRVSNVVATVVSVTATGPIASETGPSPGIFTFTRTTTGTPLTVNYTVGGTASNGIDYTNALGGPLSGTITFAAGDSSTNLTFVPIDDTLSEPVETVIVTVANGVGYVAAGSATATILDNNDPPLLIASAGAPSMYERHTNDYASVKITRWGDTTVPLVLDASNFTYAGSAVLNTDYIINSNVFPFNIDANTVETLINLVSPLDNAVYTGNKTIVIGLAAGTGFSVASSNATLTIIDDENPPAPVLYTNPLTSAADAVNWNRTFANGDLATLGPDFETSFGYDLTANASGGGIIAPPPGGANNALRVTVNKTVGSNAGVDLYPTNFSFSGDYAVRFNMNVIIDSGSGTTQGPIFGINHDGKETNWWAGSGVASGGPWASDGVWYWISADAGAAAGDYLLFTGLNGALPNTGWTHPIPAGLAVNFTNAFKGPPAPYTGYAGPGLVANDPPPPVGTADTSTWTDVQIKQIGRIVTLYLNKIQVFTYSNTTTFTNGTLMLGYSDPFDSVGAPSGAVYYANLSVVRLGPPQITSINRSGSTVTVKFSSSDGTDTVGSFKLQKSTLVTGTYADDNTATVTQLPDGTYQATTTSTPATQFFRIRKL